MNISQGEILVEDLVIGCKKKCIKCQELLYKKYFGYALSIAIRYITDRNDAIEIVDDCFIKIFDKIEKYDNKYEFKPWLRKIIINTAIDKIRVIESRHEQRLNGSDILKKSEHETDSNLGVKEILSLLKKLQPTHRIVFNLFEIEGFNHKEIGDMLKIPESSSRTYLTRAKKELRRLYTKYFQ